MPIKVLHLVRFNGSGMFSVAESLYKAELKLGLDSHLVNIDTLPVKEYDKYADADIVVPHTNLPTEMRKRLKPDYKMVFVSHGTPTHIMNQSMLEGKLGYGHADPLMLWMHWMKTADAIVTFWPRHQMIMQQMCDKHTKVQLVPLGLEHDFWSRGQSKGKYAGTPSVFSCENGHAIKRPFDLFVMWPIVYEAIPDAVLHVTYLPLDQHRWIFPFVNRNGAAFGSHISPLKYEQSELRNLLKSVDVYFGGVQYGDFNRMSMEANVAGCTTISYVGNPFSMYWIHEGDQRVQAAEMIEILKGNVEPRPDRQPVPDIKETAEAMNAIYESIL